MKITKLQVENFRLLKNFSMDLEKELSLVIGKNNTGKTSILSVLDKFLNEKSKFSYDDFNIDFKNGIVDLITSTSTEEFDHKGIKLKLFIEYNEHDDLSNISRVMMDLDPENSMIVLGFEYTISYVDFQRLRTEYKNFVTSEQSKVDKQPKDKLGVLNEFLMREIGNYFRVHKKSFEYDMSNQKVNEANFIDLKEEFVSIKDIVSFKYISARRDVTNKERESTLSKQTSNLYKKKRDNREENQATEEFKDLLSETDITLSGIYKDLFRDVIKKVQNFGGVKLNDTEIAIVSTLQHRNLLEGNATVVYTHDSHQLPEHYNGLGYMNLISMIFEIEILVQDFKRDKNQKPADINLLIIEEPEAHTHPQMQYIFIKNIKKLLSEGIKRDDGINKPLQYIITTHSSHIVADSDFADIKYLKTNAKNSVIAKNLSDLMSQYAADPKQYQFLKQYLTISRAEIFFADKAILIEGDTERILIPTFMRKVDLEEATRLKATNKNDIFLPLLSQNISIVEVGAYSHIFKNFIGFLGIKTMILTDIDANVVKQNKNGKDVRRACPVNEGTETSNAAIKYFLTKFTWNEIKKLPQRKRIFFVESSMVCICYQQEEESYHARSFEESFIHINKAFVNDKKDEFQGLKNRELFENSLNSAYKLADSCIDKKTHFALDILFHSDKDFSNWKIPTYIKEGLLWLKED